MASAYPAAVKSFTALNTGDTIQDTDIEAVYDEVNAIETALLTSGLAHHLFPDATSRTLGTSAKPWGTTYLSALKLNQGAADDEIISLKSTDIAHGRTSITETDTYGFLTKLAANSGGVLFKAVEESAVSALQLYGVAGAESATRSTAARAGIELNASLGNGTTDIGFSADMNLMCIQTKGGTRFIFDSDGDSHQDVGTAWTNFDDGDDLVRLDAVAVTLARDGDPLRSAFVQQFEERRAVLEAMPGKPLVTFNDDGHHFVNMSRLTMLLTGAVRQLAKAQAQQTRALIAAGVVTPAQLEAAW